jgi:hypothetical protein
MELEFVCIESGKKLYTVRAFGLALFTGTQDECRRFQEIRQDKLAREREDDLKPRRHPAFVPRTYRTAKIHA